MITRERFDAIQSNFTEAGCTLLTTFEEAKEMDTVPSLLRLRFIGTCCHESQAYYTNFRNRKTGIICKECILQKSKNRKLTINIENHIQEKDSINYISTLLKKEYEVQRTPEGCFMDLLLRPKGATEDTWIPVQLKATSTECHSMYAFHNLQPKYKDSLILCHAITENKLWLLPYNNLPDGLRKLNISYKIRSKYGKYFLEDNQTLCAKIQEYKDSYTLTDFETATTPSNKYQKREQVYVKKRKQYFPFLPFVEAPVQSDIYDFTVNGKRVQEKVIGLHSVKKHVLVCSLSTRNGKKRRTYCIGENDFYWFHSSVNNSFWIVPENILYDKGFISDKTHFTGAKHFIINLNRKNWMDAYKFDYTNLTESCVARIKGMFSIL